MDFYGHQPAQQEYQDSIEFDELEALEENTLNFGQNEELLEEDQFISESSHGGEGQSFD